MRERELVREFFLWFFFGLRFDIMIRYFIIKIRF